MSGRRRHTEESGGRAPRHKERGAVLLELALVMPILALFVFGILEFGWLLAQHIEVRHGARETGRLAAVNANPSGTSSADTQRDDIIAEACSRVSLSDTGAVTIIIDFPDLDAPPADREAGDPVEVTFILDYADLTGYLAFATPDELRSSITTRLEATASYSATDPAGQACP